MRMPRRIVSSRLTSDAHGGAFDAAGVVFVQYREGLVDSLARTQADRDAIAGTLDANRGLMTQRLAVVDVYRALGGGWQ